MGEQRMSGGNVEEEMDRRVVEALERVPAVEIPTGFAARVAGQLPMRRAVAVTPARYGLLAARIGMAVLLLAIVVVAMHSANPSKLGVVLQWILCAQVVGLALWLSDVRSLIAPER
jgi:hypothetical protein